MKSRLTDKTIILRNVVENRIGEWFMTRDTAPAEIKKAVARIGAEIVLLGLIGRAAEDRTIEMVSKTPGFEYRDEPYSMGGFTIIEDHTLIDYTLDWSSCRSPSRAKRRRRLGYEQKVKIVECYPRTYTVGNRIICHPSIAQMIRDRFKNTTHEL